ncbi:MAG: hypothetical protein M3N06_02610, partial [Pseudomonadota bacterium]|nr:hypothetical protein [Pseudomonadota bacterium]
RKLKVFQAHIGFYDTVVAAASMPAALRAWGVRQDLFASGQARVTDDAQAVAAALANAEVPLRRVIGTNDPFELNPTGLPTVPDAPRAVPDAIKQAAARPAKPTPKPKPTTPPPDRSRLNEAEASVRQLDEARKREEAELRRRQEALDTKRAAAQDAYVEGRKQATAALVEARQAYRKLGGKD